MEGGRLEVNVLTRLQGENTSNSRNLSVVTAWSWISGVVSRRIWDDRGGIPVIRDPCPEGNVYTVFDARLANGLRWNLSVMLDDSEYNETGCLECPYP